MEKHLNIEEQLKEMSSSEISFKKNNIVCALILILAGIALFVLGTRKLVESDALNMTMIVFGLGAFIYGIVKMCMDLSSVHFFYNKTGQRLKKHKIYVSTSERGKISNMFQTRDFQQIATVKKEISSGCMLYILMTDNGDCCAIQCHDLTSDAFEPTTDAVLLTEAAAMPVYKFTREE